MTLRLRIRTAATVWATILPLIPLAGCGGDANTPDAKPEASPGSPAASTGGGTQKSGGGGGPAAPEGPKDKYAYYGKGDGYTAEQKVGRDTWRRALDCLVTEGYVELTKGSRNAKVCTSVKPYRQANDRQADGYDDIAPTPKELQATADSNRVVQLQHRRQQLLREVQEAQQALKDQA